MKLSCVVNLAHIALGLSIFGSPVLAASSTTQTVLVAEWSSGRLAEYSLEGVELRSLFVPMQSPDGINGLRDIVQGTDGRVHAYNGTFMPVMTTLDPLWGSFTNRSASGWSTVNDTTYGGIAAIGSFVFVTDMSTTNALEAGLIRFNLDSGLSTRFGDTELSSYRDLNVGLDGLLYALSGGSQIEVYDPTTLGLIRNFSIGDEFLGDVRGIAIDMDGSIFAAEWSGSLKKYDATGTTLEQELDLGTPLSDIDIAGDGSVLVGSRFGEVFMTTRSLSVVSSFKVGGEFGPDIHTSFSTQVSSVPEPSGTTLIGLGLGFLASAIRRKVPIERAC